MQLYVEKDTDLMRSTFTAIGLAALFDGLPEAGTGLPVRLRDGGSAYIVDVPYTAEQAVEFLWQKEGRLPVLLPAILKPPSEKERKAVEAGGSAEQVRLRYVPRNFPKDREIDYGKQKEKADAAKKQKKGERQEGDEVARHRDFPVWAHLCSYFGKGSAMRTVYPTILHAWHAHRGENAEALLNLILTCYSQVPNDLAGLQAEWERSLAPALDYADFEIDAEVTASSVVSPSTVQGSAALAVGSKLNNEPLTAFWLEMYFAFAGYMLAGMPFTLGSDVMLYYPLPRDIGVSRLRGEMDNYRDSQDARQLYRFSNQMMRAKLDVLAHVTYYKSMINHFRINAADEEWGDLTNAMTGLVGYYYKENGGTQIPFDETLFTLPRWLIQPNEEQLTRAYTLLNAHHSLLDALRGKPPKYALTADELHIFNAYRRFITMGETDAWIDFAIAYNAYRFRNMEDVYLPDLHHSIFKETVLMSLKQTDRNDYQEIFDNQGFQHIAAAIRECTVDLVYRTRGKNPQHSNFKIRYGLGDDLLRNAHDSDLFAEALGEFVFDYQRESSNVFGATGEVRRFPRNIGPSDVEQVMSLIPKYRSGVVAKLLVASGYCSNYPIKSESSSS